MSKPTGKLPRALTVSAGREGLFSCRGFFVGDQQNLDTAVLGAPLRRLIVGDRPVFAEAGSDQAIPGESDFVLQEVDDTGCAGG